MENICVICPYCSICIIPKKIGNMYVHNIDDTKQCNQVFTLEYVNGLYHPKVK